MLAPSNIEAVPVIPSVKDEELFENNMTSKFLFEQPKQNKRIAVFNPIFNTSEKRKINPSTTIVYGLIGCFKEI